MLEGGDYVDGVRGGFLVFDLFVYRVWFKVCGLCEFFLGGVSCKGVLCINYEE